MAAVPTWATRRVRYSQTVVLFIRCGGHTLPNAVRVEECFPRGFRIWAHPAVLEFQDALRPSVSQLFTLFLGIWLVGDALRNHAALWEICFVIRRCRCRSGFRKGYVLLPQPDIEAQQLLEVIHDRREIRPERDQRGSRLPG